MSTHCTSKDQELVGRQCQETGGKIGKATLTSTDKASPSRSPPETGEASFPIMPPHPIGRSVRRSQARNSAEEQLNLLWYHVSKFLTLYYKLVLLINETLYIRMSATRAYF